MTRSKAPQHRAGRAPARHRPAFTTTALAGLTATVLAAAAATVPTAAAAEPEPEPRNVAVINANFNEPSFTSSGSGDKLTGWTVQYPYRLLPSDAAHPDNLPALLLRNKRATDQSISQRLRGVRAGAKVTVTFDDNAGGRSRACTDTQLTAGQPYTLQGSGGPQQRFTTDPGSTTWHRERTYTFTANENEPLITFASAQTTGTWDCGPLIAKVRATHIPPALNMTVAKNRLPAPEAFEGNERITVRTAADHCAKARTNCTYTADTPYSYTYYDKARMIGETYFNCTRNTISHDRPVRFVGRSYDSLSQQAGIDRLSTLTDNVNQQFESGVAASSPEPWRWTTTSERKIHEIIEVGEASWIEAQPGRQRIDGWFTSDASDPDKQIRLHVVADGPSPLVPDRIYQRTGPMTTAEKTRCRSDRPSAPTPVGAETPAAATDRND
ncbi:hypothetical protein [Streptomyces sp. NPDC017988]|uniref:hypothetical protein n=1 Tax=Streptomyces sp. NPDC017988 TaxID=3365025 RepID=UPI0037A53CE8